MARLRLALEYLVSPLQIVFVPKLITPSLFRSLFTQYPTRGVGKESWLLKLIWRKLMIVSNRALLRTLLLCLSSQGTSSPLLSAVYYLHPSPFSLMAGHWILFILQGVLGKETPSPLIFSSCAWKSLGHS